MKKTFDVKRLTTLALLTTIALIICCGISDTYACSNTRVKLGLANIVTLLY
ncbi:MAG: hypothetical protein ACLT33_13255 [Lachnospira pectinoschiza]